MRPETRSRFKLIFWTLVALGLLLFPFLLASSACAQDTRISAPEDLKNPRTGERGTWIPRWVEHEHVLDAHKLQQCQGDLQSDLELIFALEERSEALEKAIVSKDSALLTSLETTMALERQKEGAAAKLERRTRLSWALTGVSLALAATTTTLALLR